jgi:hypothetical protein
MRGGDLAQRSFEPAHRAHGVGEHQHLEPAGEGGAKHRHHVAVHEGLAAGEADLARSHSRRLVEISLGLGDGQIDERVVGRRAFDVAALAGEVAERAGVDPQRVEPLQRDMRAPLAFGGDERVAELGRVERARGRIGEGRRFGQQGSGDGFSPSARTDRAEKRREKGLVT